MIVSLNYGSKTVELDIPQDNISFNLSPASFDPVSDEEDEIARAIRNPIGCEPLHERVNPGDQAVIIADDMTRLTPADKIIPVLLDELSKAGVGDSSIRIIIATGSHRSMGPGEISAKFGPRVVGRIGIDNHVHTENLLDCGQTTRGTRIWVNKDVMEADVRIGGRRAGGPPR